MYSVSHAQLMLAKGDPGSFRDGLVSERAPGTCSIEFLDGLSAKFRIFEAPADYGSFQIGDPVAFHAPAEVLAEKDFWVSARPVTDDVDNGYRIG